MMKGLLIVYRLWKSMELFMLGFLAGTMKGIVWTLIASVIL
jgi:hypothetical protein